MRYNVGVVAAAEAPDRMAENIRIFILYIALFYRVVDHFFDFSRPPKTVFGFNRIRFEHEAAHLLAAVVRHRDYLGNEVVHVFEKVFLGLFARHYAVSRL